eukprot:jgi/Ulvmu1/557/UM001_0565.1
MSEFGHIHAITITNRSGSILYERLFDRLSEIQKAELRTALGQCSRDVARMANGHVGVGNFRGATIVFQPFDSLVYFGVGSGEYDELTLLSVMQCLVMSLKTVLKTSPTEQVLLSKYEKVCLVVDEIIHEGILDTLAPTDVVESIKMKA